MTDQLLEKMFTEAWEKHSDSIFRFVFFKINNREKTLDLVQETFMKTWIHISKNGSPENTKAFLYKVAGNLVIDEYRKRGRKESDESLDELAEVGFEPSKEESEVESMINRLDGEKVMEMINTLPEMYSSIMFMKYNEELSIPEISDILEVSPNVVSVRLNRAIKKLKENFETEMKKYQK